MPTKHRRARQYIENPLSRTAKIHSTEYRAALNPRVTLWFNPRRGRRVASPHPGRQEGFALPPMTAGAAISLPLAAGFFRNPDWILVLGVLMLTVWAMMRLASRRKRGQPNLSAQEQLERNHQARGVRGDLEDLMVEIEQMAKRMSAQLDAKAIRLERLLDETDQRIAYLEQLQQRQSAAPDTASTPDAPDPLQTPDAPHAGVARHPAAAATQAPSFASPPPVDDLQDDPLLSKVYQLADAGLDANAIAREIGDHVGKVELILALRRV